MNIEMPALVSIQKGRKPSISIIKKSPCARGIIGLLGMIENLNATIQIDPGHLYYWFPQESVPVSSITLLDPSSSLVEQTIVNSTPSELK